jgi:hypothetical protein
MKHHALLGLILGLLATAKLAGQPVLFNVTFNPEGNLFTITGTGTQANAINFSGSGNVPASLDSFQGITLLNFFPGNFTPGGFAADVDDIPVTGDRTLKVNVGGGELFLDLGAYTGTLIGNVPSGSIEAFNVDKNVNLYTSTGTPLLFNAGTIVFSGTVSFTSTNTPVDLALAVSGPRNVYAGLFDAYNGDAFLGTYTLTVVPEPSTYAAIAGGLGLVAAVLHRRRQRARASAA